MECLYPGNGSIEFGQSSAGPWLRGAWQKEKGRGCIWNRELGWEGEQGPWRVCGSLLTMGWTRKIFPFAVGQTPCSWWPCLPCFPSRMMVFPAAGAALAVQGFCSSPGKGPRPFHFISCSRQLPEPGGEPNSVLLSRCHKKIIQYQKTPQSDQSDRH